MRNRYLEAFGVVAPVWHQGNPPIERSPIVCEVWRSELTAHMDTPTKPQVRISASLEVRIAGQVVGWDGKMENPQPGIVRRWFRMAVRSQYVTVTIDRWR